MILIKNAKVIDGTEKPTYPANILISGNKILAIGHFINRKAEVVIDGLGMYIIPGFIDIHTHTDHTLDLFLNASQEHYRKQGITTFIGGHDGASLAPLIHGSLRSIRKWVKTPTINVNWHSIHEFQKTINTIRLGVNFTTCAGHTTIRRDIAGDTDTDLSDTELAVLLNVIEHAIQEGARGVSIALNTAHGKQTPYYELKKIAEIIARTNSILAISLRNTTHRIAALNEIVTLYKTTGATIIITNLLETFDGADEKEITIAHDLINNTGDHFFIELPLGQEKEIPIYHLLPHFAQIGNLNAMWRGLQNPAHRTIITNKLPRIHETTKIINAPSEYRTLIGKTIKEFAINRNLSLKAGLIELMNITKMRATLTIPTQKNPHIELLMNYSRTLLSGPIAAIIKETNQKRWPIEKTVARLTNIPAQIFNLPNRGIIQENYYADCLLINDRCEVRHTIVNGNLLNGGLYIP